METVQDCEVFELAEVMDILEENGSVVQFATDCDHGQDGSAINASSFQAPSSTPDAVIDPVPASMFNSASSETDDQFRARLLKHGLQKRNVSGDGNMFFECVATALFNDVTMSDSLRIQTYLYMRDSSDQYRVLLGVTTQEEYQEQIQNVLRPASTEKPNMAVIQALCDSQSINLVIHEENSKIFLVKPNSENVQKTICLSYQQMDNRFNLLENANNAQQSVITKIPSSKRRRQGNNPAKTVAYPTRNNLKELRVTDGETSRPENNHETDEAFRERLKNNGLVLHPMPADGSCMYYAVARAFFGDQALQNRVRTAVYQQLINNYDMYGGALEDVNQDQYVTNVKRFLTTEWGNHVALQALADATGIRFIIYEANFLSTEVLPREGNYNGTVKLSLHDPNLSFAHYNLLEDPLSTPIIVPENFGTSNDSSQTTKKLFECSVCAKTFPLKETLKRHQKIHLDEKEFQCNLCKYEASQKYRMREHLVNKHKLPRASVDSSFTQNTPPEKICSSTLPACIEEPVNIPHECLFCNQILSSYLELESHMRTHTGEQLFSCEKCDYATLSKDSLEKHGNGHDGVLRFGCKKCGYKTDHWYAIEQHRLIHPNFITRIVAGSHQFSSKISVSKNKKRNMRMDHGNFYTCPVCFYKTYDKNKLTAT